MSDHKPSHPPVLPVGMLFRRNAAGEWSFDILDDGCEYPPDELKGDMRAACAALQRCAWLDEAKKQYDIYNTLFINADDSWMPEDRQKYLCAFRLESEAERNAAAWAAWVNEAHEEDKP